MMKDDFTFNTIEEAIAAIKAGKMVLVHQGGEDGAGNR